MSRLALVIALALALPARAFADAKSEARARMERATELHAQGKYSEALGELTTAYSLDPRAEILYAIAQTYVQLGNCPQAITFYERFLSTHPGATPAAAAQEAIDACKTGAGTPPTSLPSKLELSVPEPSAPEPSAPEPDLSGATAPPVAPPVERSDAPQPWYRDGLGYALVGGGVVCSLIAIVTYRTALGDLDEADAATDYQHHADLVDSAHSKRTISAVLAIGSAGLIGAGVARFVLHDRHAEHPGVAFAPLRGGGILGWTRRF